MIFTINKNSMFPRLYEGYPKPRPISKRLAVHIVHSILREYKTAFPLAWDTLQEAVLLGDLQSTSMLFLTFTTEYGLLIEDIYLDDKGNVLQIGQCHLRKIQEYSVQRKMQDYTTKRALSA